MNRVAGVVGFLGEISAVAEVALLLSPMVSVAWTGFVVPAKLAPFAFASKRYRKVPVGLISSPSPTPMVKYGSGSTTRDG